jgi:hypothetical protein
MILWRLARHPTGWGVIQCQTYIPTSVILKALVRSRGSRSGTTSCTPRSAILTALVRSPGIGLGNLLLARVSSYALKSRPAQRTYAAARWKYRIAASRRPKVLARFPAAARKPHSAAAVSAA